MGDAMTDALAYPRECQTTPTPTGLLVHVTFHKPLDRILDVVAIVRDTLSRQRLPEPDLTRFDWALAVTQRGAGSGRYVCFLPYRVRRRGPRTTTIQRSPDRKEWRHIVRKIALSFVAGVVVTLAAFYHCGPDAIVQTGLRMAAMQASYDFVSVPREAHAVSYDTRALLAAQSQPAPTAKAKARR
jgi:hypothetical protein